MPFAALRPPRRFEFERDSFAFPNKLVWEYHFDAASGQTTFSKREPKPDYAHRCFVLTDVRGGEWLPDTVSLRHRVGIHDANLESILMPPHPHRLIEIR